MPGFSMSVGGRGGQAGRGQGLAGGRGRGRGTGCSLFQLDEEPVRKLQLLGDPVPPPAGQAPAATEVTTEVDPLDAFMAGNDKEAAKPIKIVAVAEEKPNPEWEADDPVASYCEAFEEGKVKQDDGAAGSDEEMMEVDPDDLEAMAEAKGAGKDGKGKAVAPLPRVDHSIIEYQDVKIDFYTPHPEIAKLEAEQVAALKKERNISTTGPQVPTPVVSFAHLGLPSSLMEGIRRHGYSTPTPIQSQALPAGLSGRDVVGVAQTGSGKTVSYLMPLLVHCADQPALQKDEGPIAIVLCPTRELAIQVEKETFKFNKLLGLRSTTLAGGLSKKEQFKDIKKGSEIIIANPGRMIDIIKMKGFNLQRCTFLVLDEADRMLHMGFEYQVRSLVQNIRPNHQTLLFSATLPPRIERLASDLLKNPVRIVVGELGGVADTVTQIVDVLDDEDAKWSWLSKRVPGMLSKGQLLVFVKSKLATDELVKNFTQLLETEAVALHGDLEQGDRMKTLDSFRDGKVTVLVATDLAARGLDVPTIRTVVSYDAPRDIETHTHRVGRTGRAGIDGEAFTLLTDEKHDRKMASQIFSNLKHMGKPTSAALAALAQKHTPFRAAKMQEQQRNTSSSSPAAAAAGESAHMGRARSRSRSR